MNKQLKYVNGQMYEYEIYPLIDSTDNILHSKIEKFSFETPPIEARYLAISLIETLKSRGGLGIAANQCGLPYRVFVMGTDGVGYAFFNPEIIETTGEVLFEEGCLSFPGLFLKIKRPETVKIKYQDMNGLVKEEKFSGLSARIVLHEYDHMEGVVFTSKVPKLILDKAKQKRHKNLKILQHQNLEKVKQELIKKAMQKVVSDNRLKIDVNQTDTVDPNKFLKFKA